MRLRAVERVGPVGALPHLEHALFDLGILGDGSDEIGFLICDT